MACLLESCCRRSRLERSDSDAHQLARGRFWRGRPPSSLTEKTVPQMQMAIYSIRIMLTNRRIRGRARLAPIARRSSGNALELHPGPAPPLCADSERPTILTNRAQGQGNGVSNVAGAGPQAHPLPLWRRCRASTARIVCLLTADTSERASLEDGIVLADWAAIERARKPAVPNCALSAGAPPASQNPST